MWIFLGVGFLFHILGDPDLFVGSWLISAFMFVFWWQIHRRAKLTEIEPSNPKREHKHPAYRERKK